MSCHMLKPSDLVGLIDFIVLGDRAGLETQELRAFREQK